jgi:plasmid stabilization system protein ParE
LQRKLQFTDRALADVHVIRAWLTQPGAGRAARRRLTAILTGINRLVLHPAGQHTGVREMPCDGGYRAFYEVTPDTGRSETAGDVRVLRVFGPGQDRSQI